MTKPMPPESKFDLANFDARVKWENTMEARGVQPSFTDSFTDGFWEGRDWCLQQMLERFKDAPEHHAELYRLLGKNPP